MSISSRPSAAYCAIDFGTSNSAVAIGDSLSKGAAELVWLEAGQPTIPSAVFYDSEDASRLYGRAAIDAYIDSHPGRLMRSLKSILGTALIDETTNLGDGIAVRYIDVIAGFLNFLKKAAELKAGSQITQVVLGRPVYFVDDDPVADARAQEALAKAARAIGFTEVSFQFEPIAAALDYEQKLTGQRLVMVADIGGGTSDFTVIKIGGEHGLDRSDDVLASYGVHVAGTDFDHRVELDALMPDLGFRARTPEGREVPNRIYYDLATWHLINGVYAPKRVAELTAMSYFYANPQHHARLLRVVQKRLGHRLMGRAEDAKIALSAQEEIEIDLSQIEDGLRASYGRLQLEHALEGPLDKIVGAALETARQAGVAPGAIEALYFTGGSTGLRLLARRLASAFPGAEAVYGDRFSSVATGLGIEAVLRYGAHNSMPT